MRQIRRNVFETNSSSTHSITMCMKSDFDKWIAAEMVWDRYNQQLISITDEIKKLISEDEDNSYLTYKQFCDYEVINFDKFSKTYTTPNGERVVSFGYYGYDG